jgi:hypothetical protein
MRPTSVIGLTASLVLLAALTLLAFGNRNVRQSFGTSPGYRAACPAVVAQASARIRCHGTDQILRSAADDSSPVKTNTAAVRDTDGSADRPPVADRTTP